VTEEVEVFADVRSPAHQQPCGGKRQASASKRGASQREDSDPQADDRLLDQPSVFAIAVRHLKIRR
jgi:hypothetical protein